MKRIIELIKRIINLGAIDSDYSKSNHLPSKITNKMLLRELVDHFNEQLEELSVGHRLLYPMSFNILMHPNDYEKTKESLPFVLPEVIAAFYVSLKEKIKDYGDVNYAPPATYWFFQFSACSVAKRGIAEEFIKQGEIITTGSLTTYDFRNSQNNVRSEKNVHLSVKCQNSKTNNNNINLDALMGMEILSEGSYSFDFDKNLNEDTNYIASTSNLKHKGWAELRWTQDGDIKVYNMVDNYIDISGSLETRKMGNICVIQSAAVNISHVQIKYDQTTQSFYLAAFAKTRLNSREVPLSIGGNPQWVLLPKFNSKIFINDAVSIEFNANSEIV